MYNFAQQAMLASTPYCYQMQMSMLMLYLPCQLCQCTLDQLDDCCSVVLQVKYWNRQEYTCSVLLVTSAPDADSFVVVQTLHSSNTICCAAVASTLSLVMHAAPAVCHEELSSAAVWNLGRCFDDKTFLHPQYTASTGPAPSCQTQSMQRPAWQNTAICEYTSLQL